MSIDVSVSNHFQATVGLCIIYTHHTYVLFLYFTVILERYLYRCAQLMISVVTQGVLDTACKANVICCYAGCFGYSVQS